MSRRNESMDKLCYFHRNHCLISDGCRSSGANSLRIENMDGRSCAEIEDASCILDTGVKRT
jgi:hypothetical protein